MDKPKANPSKSGILFQLLPWELGFEKEKEKEVFYFCSSNKYKMPKLCTVKLTDCPISLRKKTKSYLLFSAIAEGKL